VPAAPVLSIEEAVSHPHLRERGTVQTVHDRLLGHFQIPGFPLRFSACPHRLDLEAPTLGEHNEEILSRYLGYLPERIRQLERDGILYREAR
jgi:CoA:oxalate CoA-transferase